MTTFNNHALMSVFRPIGNFAILVGLGLLVGCNLSHKSTADVGPAPTAPFDAMIIRHTVADYGKWKPIYDADGSFREAAGVHAVGVARGMENANDVEIPTVIDDVQKAKAFGANPRLKEVMQKGGVSSAPDIKFVRVLRFADGGKCDYAEVISKVKDFDAWVKVFDSEGPATRKKDGLGDIVMGRGIDDPNMVYLVFKIKSVAEAKAAMAMPERQKLMKEGGVVGEPTIYFGSDQ